MNVIGVWIKLRDVSSCANIERFDFIYVVAEKFFFVWIFSEFFQFRKTEKYSYQKF